MYQILDWDKHFENYKSREIDQCSFVCFPNKIGLGLSHILSMENGAAYFGIFILLAENCSRQRRPRAGYCTDTGKPDGREWSKDDIALMVRRPLKEVESALDILTSDKVGWIIELEQTPSNSTRRVPTAYPPSTLEGRKEQKERKKKIASGDASVHKSTIEHFCESWKKRYGAEYPFKGKDAAHVKWIRQQVKDDPEAIRRIIDTYFRSQDPFIVRDMHSLGLLVSQFRKFIVRESENGNSHGRNIPIKEINADTAR